MTEIEIFSKTFETVGIVGFIIISSAVLIYKGMGIYSKRAEQSTLLEMKSLDNARAEREQSFKAQGELTQAVKYLADKTESVSRSQEEIARIVADVKAENKSVIDATKSAESSILIAINQAQDKHSTEIKKLGELIADLHTISRERATSDDVKKAINDIVTSFELALSKVENRLINELTKIKIHESNKFKLSDLPIPPPNAVSDSFDASKRDDNFTTGKVDTL